MKKPLLLIILIFSSLLNFGQEGVQLFPDNININNFKNCSYQLDTITLKASIIKKDFGVDGKLSYDKSQFKFLDINNDKKCEIFHYFSTGLRGWPHDFLTIYILDENSHLHKIADLGSYFTSFAVSDGQFLQINHISFKGSATNPIYYNSVLRYNGKEYKQYYSPDLTAGQFKNKGLQAYRQKDFETAYICFKNVLIFPHSTEDKYLQSLNDVAITLIKLKRYGEVEPLLLKTLKTAKNKSVKASAYYNIGLAKEFKKDLETALWYYKKSFEHKASKTAQDKINKYER